MTREKIEKKIIEITADALGLEAERITPESRFIIDLQADSLSAVEIVLQVEDAFDIDTIEQDNIETVAQLVDVVAEKIAAGS